MGAINDSLFGHYVSYYTYAEGNNSMQSEQAESTLEPTSAYTETTPVIIEAAITPAMSTAKDLFFMINISSLSVLLFITQPLYHVKVCVNPITHLRLCQA